MIKEETMESTSSKRKQNNIDVDMAMITNMDFGSIQYDDEPNAPRRMRVKRDQ